MAGPVFVEGVAEWTTTSGLTRPYVLMGAVPGADRAASWVADGDWGYWSINDGPRFEYIRGARVGSTVEVMSLLRSSLRNNPVMWPAGGARIIRLQPSPASIIDELNNRTNDIATPPYRLDAPSTGAIITLLSTDRNLLINPVSSIATLNIELPAGVDKQLLRIATRQRIDELTITPETGEFVDWEPNELPQRGRLEFRFVAPIDTWVQS